MIAVALVLVWLGAAPTAAEFSDAEKTNVHELVLSMNLVQSGIQDMVATGQYAGYWTALTAAEDCRNALGHLLGTQIKQGAADRAALAAKTRAQVLADAWYYLDRCITGAGAAYTASGFTRFDQARLGLVAFPRSGLGGPLYQSPKPATWPKVIGPHGDYDFAQEDAWFAVKYVHDSMALYPYTRYLMDVANYVTIYQAGLANVRFAASETPDGFATIGKDATDNILWLQKFALEDTAVKYLATSMNDYPQASDGDLRAAIAAGIKLNDSWKNLDRSVRNTLCINGRVACDRTPH
jgi:hypothetical protein